MRLIDFIEDWLVKVKEMEVKPSTYNLLLNKKKALSKYPIANIRVADISPDDFTNYIKQLIEHGYARTTIKELMTLVKSAMLWAYNHQIITFNPCLDAKVPAKARVKKPPRDVGAFTPEEQERLRFVLRTHKHDSYCAMELMLETGIRVGECLALDWNDVDIEKHRLHIHKTVVELKSSKKHVQEGAKTESSNRRVPISPRAVEILRELAAKNETDYLFACKNGTRLAYRVLIDWEKSVCERAGVPYRSPHAFRHTFATNQFYKEPHLFGDGFKEMLAAVS